MQDFLAAANTDTGLKREINEDRVICNTQPSIFAVIDGVGGHASGEVAADIASQRLLSVLSTTWADATSRLREAITLANNAIYEEASQEPALNGMACVVTVALLENGQVTVGHVGDTRLYKVRPGSITQVTRDHSPVGEREADGRLTEIEAMQHPRRNEIYRDVGSQPHDTEDTDFIDLYQEPFEADCALVLCSDGLTDLVPSQQILGIVERNAGTPEASVDELIAAANERGGKDNVSVIVVEAARFAAGVESTRNKSHRHANRTPAPMSPFGHAVRRPLWRRVLFGGPKPGAGNPEAGRPMPVRRRGRRLLRLALMLLTVAALAAAAGSFAPQIRRLSGWGNPQEEAAVLRVDPGEPGAFSSIGEALAQAQPGQVVEVAAGVYSERVRLRSGVSLVSVPPRRAVLRLSATDGTLDELVAVTARGAQGAGIADFRILGDEESPLRIGLRLTDSQVTVEGLEISGATQAGVEILGQDRSVLRFNQLHNNPGFGIQVSGAAAPRIVQNLIQGNGQGVRIGADARPLLIDNRLLDNEGGAILIADDAARSQYLAWNDFGDTPDLDRVRGPSAEPGPPAEE